MLIVFDEFEMDVGKRVLRAGGRVVELQPRPFEILAFLVAARDRAVSRAELMDGVWRGQAVASNNLTVQMSALRKALAEHGGDGLIVTQSGRGYQFVGKVCEVADDPPAVTVSDSGSAGVKLPQAGRRWRAGIWLAGLVAGAVLGAAFVGWSARRPFTPRVQVEEKPDTITMVPGGYCKVDYEFRVADRVALQLSTEDVRFYLVSGEPVSRASIRGRIYHGSMPILGPGRGIYHNNIWLPPDVAQAAMAEGKPDVYLRHLFHLMLADGREVDVPAVLQIVFGTPPRACAPG